MYEALYYFRIIVIMMDSFLIQNAKLAKQSTNIQQITIRQPILLVWVVLRHNFASTIFQSYCNFEAGDNQSEIEVVSPGFKPGPLVLQAKSLTTPPPPLPTKMDMLLYTVRTGTGSGSPYFLLTYFVDILTW